MKYYFSRKPARSRFRKVVSINYYFFRKIAARWLRILKVCHAGLAEGGVRGTEDEQIGETNNQDTSTQHQDSHQQDSDIGCYGEHPGSLTAKSNIQWP